MQALLFYLFLPVFYFISLLPYKLLYALSDMVYLVVYKLIGYRKNVVTANLKNAFPHKSNLQIQELAKQYYKYLCDLTLETFKTLTFTKEQALNAFSYDDETINLINSFAKNAQSTIFVIGHHGNWEWSGNPLGILFKGQVYVIYHKLSNPYFNKLMCSMRTRFGVKLIEMNDTVKAMLKNRDHISATGFIADQTPQPQNAHWMWFLNQPTPVFRGTEVIAKKFNYPVIYFTIKRIKRGKYTCIGRLICAEPKNTPDGEITETHMRLLEQDILAQPEIWLWSHKRWKHKPDKEVMNRLISLKNSTD